MGNESTLESFSSLTSVAEYLLEKLENKKYIVIFAHNGTGKTRLSMEFKEYCRKLNLPSDTLYFNAFTEDLFSWDNDLENNENRYLKMNKEAKFFAGLAELEMESRIREKLRRYVRFDFQIDYENWQISFFREVTKGEKAENIKISRGEENIFIWCFFLAIVQLVVDGQEAYSWVKYFYIDDPISSLDDNNAITVASQLSQLLKSNNNKIKVIISSHHALFFNVIYNELNMKKGYSYYLNSNEDTQQYTLQATNDTPFFHHVALLKYLKDTVESGKLFTYHFNILRNILEKTAVFHGFNNFSACLEIDEQDEDKRLHTRMLNILNHGNYSLFDPTDINEENKKHFATILHNFMKKYHFNPEIFEKIDSPNRN
ncbi:AAA family ATPase [Pigmentibacter ruber]